MNIPNNLSSIALENNDRDLADFMPVNMNATLLQSNAVSVHNLMDSDVEMTTDMNRNISFTPIKQRRRRNKTRSMPRRRRRSTRRGQK